MLLGLALVTEIDKFDWGGHLAGDTMVVVAAFGYAVNAFVIRHIMRVMDEEAVALYNHSISMVGFVAIAAAGGDLVRWPESIAEPAVWGSILASGVIAAVSLPLYYVALRRMDVWKLRAFMLSAPVITAAVEWPLWGVRLSLLQWWGAAIILGGLAVLTRIESRASADPRQHATAPPVPPNSNAQASHIVPAPPQPRPPLDNRKDKIA